MKRRCCFPKPYIARLGPFPSFTIILGAFFACAAMGSAGGIYLSKVSEQAGESTVAQEKAGNPAGQGIPISKYLRADGMLDLPNEGIQGSLDPTGFEIVSGPDGRPRFVRTDLVETRASSNEGCWDKRFSIPGTNGTVMALAWDGANLYAGGSFTTAGDVLANYVAKWNGNAWSPLGSGMDNYVQALLWDGTNLYAGGLFKTAGGVPANYIAKYDGRAWNGLGTGMYSANPSVSALAWDGTNLYAGGTFWMSGGVVTNCIAKWDGMAWSALGSGMQGFYQTKVYALVWDGTYLYAGGDFIAAGGITAANIAKWDGSTWSPLGWGMNYPIYALAWVGANLYAGGSFTSVGDVAANHIAKWDGSTWNAIGAGIGDVSSTVYSLAWDGSNLCAGGDFTTAGGVSANCIAKWDGNAWSPLDDGMGGSDCADVCVYALASDGSKLYAGGSFSVAGGIKRSCAAIWNGDAWAGMPDSGHGIRGSAIALAWDGKNLYASGWFLSADGINVNHIAKWDGNTWSPLGSGMSGRNPCELAMVGVSALLWDGTNLYVGGRFTKAGGVPANNIAMWNGSAWSALGTGLGDEYSWVEALAWDGKNLYAGGWFWMAGDVAVNCIAKWDGSAWSALSYGLSSEVRTLLWDGKNLYAGGWFGWAGDVAVNLIAKWNGSAWSPLGSGMEGTDDGWARVSALAWDGTHLYAGGYFPTAGGMAANNIAMWDGTVWSPLGSGIGDTDAARVRVGALAWDGVSLYAGGIFTIAGGVSVNNIAKWNGTGWSALGSGVNDGIGALAWNGSGLYIGGGFSAAGDAPSSCLAHWSPYSCHNRPVLPP